MGVTGAGVRGSGDVPRGVRLADPEAPLPDQSGDELGGEAGAGDGGEAGAQSPADGAVHQLGKLLWSSAMTRPQSSGSVWDWWKGR